MSRRGGRPLRSRGGLKAAKGSNRAPEAVTDNEQEEHECLTCTEVMEYFADCRCSHRVVCARCSVKMRAFSHRFHCIICKEDQTAVVISSDFSKKFEDYSLGTLRCRVDEKGGKHKTYFASDEAEALVKEALGYSCGKCGTELTSMRTLKAHLRDTHGLQFCVVCVENLKMFLSEQKLYSKSELKRHIQGTQGPDGEQVGGHPYCEFCGRPFLDSDMLWQHMEKEHVACHICARQEEMYQYFEDYKSLEKHFDSAHYLCPDRMCREQRNIVFATALDLQAHKISVHLSSKNLSQAEKKKAFSLDLWSETSSNGRQGRDTRSRRGGRQEHSRQTREERQQREERPQRDVPSPPPSVVPEPRAMVESSNDVVLHVPRTKEELRERNKQVMVSVKEALSNTSNGMEKLKALSRDFKNGRLNAAEYHKKFLSLFGTTNGIPIYLDLAALLPDVKQRAELLEAHLQWKEKREKFPQVGSEPRPTVPATGGIGPSAIGAEVSAASSNGPTDTSSAEHFPSLGGSSSVGRVPPGLSIAGAAVYANRGRPAATEFPALVSNTSGPASSTVNAADFQPSVAQWGSEAPQEEPGGRRRRKKKNQKVTLFSTGMRYN